MSGGALAQTSDTGTLTVSAGVANVCVIGVGTLDFGTLSLATAAATGALGTTADVSASIAVPVACTSGASAKISANSGLNADGTVRRMASGSDRLSYELYTNSALTTALDGTGVDYTGTGASGTFTVYGKVAGTAIAAARKGTYSDSVTLTITYTP